MSSGFDGEPTFPASPELLLSAKVIRGTILGHKPLSALIFQTNLHSFTSLSLANTFPNTNRLNAKNTIFLIVQ